MRLSTVTTHAEALAVALIRNECRQWMTSDQTVLDVRRQYAFLAKLRGTHSTRLFLVHEAGIPCGYGVIRIRKDRACLTGGLAEPFRGKGLGRELFLQLIQYCAVRLLIPWLEVLKTNRRAIRLYKSLGFKTVKTTKRVLVMEL